jgi:hypothetical protein
MRYQTRAQPETVLVDICDTDGDKYRFGFNGQEKVNEWSGVGNHNTALFWEYDTRTARRYNIDPVDQVSISNYATFANNPIVNVDILGDVVKASQEANTVIQDGLKRTLGETAPDANGGTKAKGPIGYDDKTQLLTYDDNADLSGFDEKQLTIIGRYKSLIESQSTIVTVEIVNMEDRIPAGKGSLANDEAIGLTVRENYTVSQSFPLGREPKAPLEKVTVEKIESQNLSVYIARDPSRTLKSSGGSNALGGYQSSTSTTVSYPQGTSGFTSIHEILGHAFEFHSEKPRHSNNTFYGRMQNVMYPQPNHNKLVEAYDQMIRSFYKMDNGRPMGGKADTHD